MIGILTFVAEVFALHLLLAHAFSSSVVVVSVAHNYHVVLSLFAMVLVN